MENNLDINMMRLIKNMQDRYTPEYFEELSKNSYKEDRNYPENFSNWYFHIKDFGKFKTAKIINNQIEQKKQLSVNSTYFSRKTIDYSNLTINFDKTAWQIQRQIYAFSFRPYQLLSMAGKNISDIKIKLEKSRLKPGTIIFENEDCFTVSTIDYDIELYFDKLDLFLEAIPTISIDTFSKNLITTLGVNDRNGKGWSPIIVAAYHGRRELVNFLLQNGANINDRNYRGTTVLMYAKDYALENNDSDFFKYLIEQVADISM